MFQGMCQLGSLTLQAACSLSSPRGTMPAYPQPKRSSFSYPLLRAMSASLCIALTLHITLYPHSSLCNSVSVCVSVSVSSSFMPEMACKERLCYLLCDIDQCFRALCSISRRMQHPQRDLFNFGPLPPHLGQKSMSKRDVQLTNLHVIYTKKVKFMPLYSHLWFCKSSRLLRVLHRHRLSAEDLAKKTSAASRNFSDETDDKTIYKDSKQFIICKFQHCFFQNWQKFCALHVASWLGSAYQDSDKTNRQNVDINTRE